MYFRVTHTTEYEYAYPASESFAELRQWPLSSQTQKVISRKIEISPKVQIDTYTDYFGNNVEFFSIPYRHNKLTVTSHAEVQTFPLPDLSTVLNVTVGEARQIYQSSMLHLFEFLQPTQLVPLYEVLAPLRTKFFQPAQTLGDALNEVNSWIFEHFKYEPGVTDVATPLEEVIKKRHGVCQDFAHLFLSILRTHGIPARYRSGYIEAFDPEDSDPELIGAAASHAWVEAYLPGGFWLGLDPTNNQIAGERHVNVATGRDYRDVAPMRGTYKGASNQKLQVMVSLQRK